MKFAHFIAAAVALHLAVAIPISYHKALTPRQAALLAAWTPQSKQPMWQLSGQYQGDIVLAPGQRNGVTEARLQWPNGEIPYELSEEFKLIEIGTDAAIYKSTVGVTRKFRRLKPRPRRSSDTDYIYVTGTDTGCWSYVGRGEGGQQLNLQRNGCLYYGIIGHEFLHALGFYHQQSATDRDDWIDIIWENISEGAKSNFEKSDKATSSFGEKYDYGSVLHYDKYAFSINGQPTIIPKYPNAIIGQLDALSDTDVAKLNKMYKCA